VIFIYPVNSNQWSGGSTPFILSANPNFENALKLIINPPPASADDFRNDRLVMEVF
jgi:hypothetical protein